MGCAVCEIRVFVNGDLTTAQVNINQLQKVAWSDELNALLYRCPECGTFWEAEAYSNKVNEVNLDYVEVNYGIFEDL